MSNQLKCLAVIVLIVLPLSAMGAQTAQASAKKTVLYLGTTAPVIDGTFDEWQNLAGASVETVVYGGEYAPADASGTFVLWSDNKKLYIYARVNDDLPNENDFPPPIAWRNDSVEIYIGMNTTNHNRYLKDDSQIRLVPRSKSDPEAFGVSVNDHEVPNGASAAVIYSDRGYEIEAAIPLNFLLVKKLELGQNIRVEFQVNDADEMERDVMLHWSSPKDNTYYDPSAWGDATVVALP